MDICMDTLTTKVYYIDHISGCNYVIKACLIIVCHALRIFNFLREDRQIGVHDGYIHRFTGLKFLWITWLELHSVECNYLLCDKLTLSQMCPLTTNAFPAAFLCTVNEVTTLAQCRTLWSAENEALPQREALWSTESEAENRNEISNFFNFVLFLDYELLLRSLRSKNVLTYMTNWNVQDKENSITDLTLVLIRTVN